MRLSNPLAMTYHSHSESVFELEQDASAAQRPDFTGSGRKAGSYAPYRRWLGQRKKIMKSIAEMNKAELTVYAAQLEEKLAAAQKELKKTTAAPAATPAWSRDEVLNWVRHHVAEVAVDLRLIPGVLPPPPPPPPPPADPTTSPAAPAAYTKDGVIDWLKSASADVLEEVIVTVLKAHSSLNRKLNTIKFLLTK